MTGIISAMQCELAGLRAVARDVREEWVAGLCYTVGKIDKTDVVMAVCGEGKVNAALCAQTMIVKFGVSRLINTGVAGSLSPTLHVPDVAVGTAAVQHDYDLTPIGYPKAKVLCGSKSDACPDGVSSTVLFPADETVAEAFRKSAELLGYHAECGVIATGDQFIADGAKKAELVGAYGAIACEMESGAIAQVCRVAGVPFGLLRAISDNADENAPTVFDPLRAAEISVSVVRHALKILK